MDHDQSLAKGSRAGKLALKLPDMHIIYLVLGSLCELLQHVLLVPDGQALHFG